MTNKLIKKILSFNLIEFILFKVSIEYKVLSILLLILI